MPELSNACHATPTRRAYYIYYTDYTTKLTRRAGAQELLPHAVCGGEGIPAAGQPSTQPQAQGGAATVAATLSIAASAFPITAAAIAFAPAAATLAAAAATFATAAVSVATAAAA